MRTTILFGGTNKERLVSVATAQSVSAALPEADLWFWTEDNAVYQVEAKALKAHQQPFEVPFDPGKHRIGMLSQALDVARSEDRVLVLGLHGGTAENGELQAMCESRGVAFTGAGSASSHLAFDKIAAKHFAALAGLPVAQTVALHDITSAFAKHGKLVAKPARDGSSYGLIFVNATQDIEAVRNAARHEEYIVEVCVSGTESTCGVLEQADGSLIALPPVEIIPADGAFDYRAKYIAKATQEICPGRFSPEIARQIMDRAVKAHRALSCRGYSRSDFIVSAEGPVYLETNTLPGLTAASLYPKALKAQGIAFPEFLAGQIRIAELRAKGSVPS